MLAIVVSNLIPVLITVRGGRSRILPRTPRLLLRAAEGSDDRLLTVFISNLVEVSYGDAKRTATRGSRDQERTRGPQSRSVWLCPNGGDLVDAALRRNVFAKLAWAMLLRSPQPQARRTSSWQHPQICSSPATAIATRKVRLKETLCHFGWRVFGRILQSFPREAVQVRFDEPDYATLI
jgi:hypothetical protein